MTGKTVPETGHKFIISWNMCLKRRHAGLLFSMIKRMGVVFGKVGGSRVGKQGMWFTVFKHSGPQSTVAVIAQKCVWSQLESCSEYCIFWGQCIGFRKKKKKTPELFAWYSLLKSNLQNTASSAQHTLSHIRHMPEQLHLQETFT